MAKILLVIPRIIHALFFNNIFFYNDNCSGIKMIKTKNTPLWVFLAFSAIETRKGALLLIWACVLFSVYCLPWTIMLGEAVGDLGKQLLLIDDWSWIAMMAPMTLWYILSLAWMDKNDGWLSKPAGAESA